MKDTSKEATRNLRSKVKGQIVLPSDQDYDKVRKIWNAMNDRRPALIVRCTETSEVVNVRVDAETKRAYVDPEAGVAGPIADSEHFDWTQNTRKKVLFAGAEALRALGAISKETARKGDEVVKKAFELFDQLSQQPKPVNEETFKVYLSHAVNDPASPINCEGPWRGYYYSEAAKNFAEESAKPTEAPPPEVEHRRREEERLVYPIVKRWLQGQGFKCDDTSSLRSLGKWGNPDITGLQITETSQAFHIEVATVEVKATYENWEYCIFEAVAHRRFSNRVYFALAAPQEFLTKLPRDLRYYAELYKIGILVLLLQTRDFEALVSGSRREDFSEEDVTVRELYTAPYMFVQAPYQKRFIEQGLGIGNMKGAFDWGYGIDEES
jgi:hypothetical protein